ncbi:hypothetical protein CH260_02350 [Rhodococcus sp. 05-2256-B2]|uniref:hypothetical protein n=1 Tax=unclassified Rhodococcus (in: high G+C Gram-positive bacteria) TaxID=192944 RepID=UPI000B9C0573|nr:MULTISPECIES: hypothetical protein [unclassified Rhodococcus (in: high G+C Gram-positive bacteria)]OZD78673.1 hypothetical protein CH258_21880 [Rhodococcus sp. 05-2256-B4]OZD93774.1 hypothetical protein CH257_09755 [Rhodococcus sp. 05-2256-B3]OZE00873.1 hypothetical protein CH260_02350 [Rhodococcus sp. 05-2256-B2]OZE04477.1 hypothetical protein CH285_08510 [Rhodococcus sp. 05-2256-B1]
MGPSPVRAAIIGCAAVALVAGCGSSSGGTSPSTAEPVPSTDSAASVSAQPDTLQMNLSIDGGTVEPTNQRLDASVGQTISMLITSDITDELHVHSVPEHTFEIEPGKDQLFTFTVDVPGQVDIELHHSDRTVATLVVRP